MERKILHAKGLGRLRNWLKKRMSQIYTLCRQLAFPIRDYSEHSWAFPTDTP
jgi:hypothetical protein